LRLPAILFGLLALQPFRYLLDELLAGAIDPVTVGLGRGLADVFSHQ
jgi:hypothetical protein